MGWFPGAARWKLAAGAALGALACAGGLIAPAATQAQVTPIRHVVVIYLENQSFDSILGYWCDGHPGRCPDGGMPSSVRLSSGAVVTPGTSPDTVPNVNHSVAAQVAAIDGGKMDGWQNIPGGSCAASAGYRCISGYQPAQVPNITALAQHFAISDHTSSSGDSASWAGHMDIVAASADNFFGDNPVPAKGITPGPGWGCDSDRVTPWTGPNGRSTLEPSCVPDRLPGLRFGGAFEQTPVKYIPTIMDRLDAAHLTWKLYGANSTQGGYIWSICPSFAECLDTSQHANLVPDAQFLTAAAAGTLPSFSVVTPGGPDAVASCHNGTSITACDNWAGQLVSAVEHSPDWRSTAVFITWDDCGCFYDQVPPGTNPDGTRQGPRVPLIIVSPYARPGYTDTTATTFAGILGYTERIFGLSPLGANDAAAYPFTNAFDYTQAPASPVRLVHRPLPASATRIRLTPALENDPT
jgi:phospholipase C